MSRYTIRALVLGCKNSALRISHLPDAGTSTADLNATTANGVAEEDLNTDGALSLDATEIESLNNGETDWNKGNDWWSEDANQAFTGELS